MGRLARARPWALLAVLVMPTTMGVGWTGTFTAGISQNCTISGSAFAFGNYDPTAAADDEVPGTNLISVQCTRGSSGVFLGLNAGSNGSCATPLTTRSMKSGSNVLCYDLYTTSGYSTVWGTSSPNTVTYSPVTTMGAQTFTIYGRIPAGQDVVVGGGYSDSIQAQVTF